MYIKTTKAMSRGLFILFLLLSILIMGAPGNSDAGEKAGEKRATTENAPGSSGKRDGKKNRGPKPKGALHTSGGNVFPAGKYQLTMRYIHFTRDTMYEGDSKISTPSTGPCKQDANNYRLGLRAGVFKNIDLRLMIPLNDREMKLKTRKGSLSQSHLGLGDVRLIGRYRLLAQNQGDSFNLAAGAGVKMPTGETNEKSAGQSLPGFLQPGTGSWDPLVEVAAHKMAGRHRYGANLMYRLSGSGKRRGDDFTAPDELQYNVAYVYALSKYFDVILEMNGRYMTKAKVDGQTQVNTGGHAIFITPGMNIKFTPDMHLSLGVPIAGYRDLNGRQLSEDYRVSTKFVYVF